MMSCEDNEMMTRVGPGTPGGDLLRRYWHPILASSELSEDKPIRRVRILSEDLVVYRDKSGNYGLVAEQCSHRRASLAHGRVDDDGIRCPYHGWKYGADGRCLQTPAEPEDSRMKDMVKHRAYPVRKLGGLLFAYMGPAPVPALPNWDVLAWTSGQRWIIKLSVIECNWVQAAENSVDSSHVYFLHGMKTDLGHRERYEEKHEFLLFEYGIMKRRLLPSKTPGGPDQVDQHPLLFPGTLRHVLGASYMEPPEGVASFTRTGFVHDLHFRVPIDDTHTLNYLVFFQGSETVHTARDADVPVKFFPTKTEDGEYRLDKVYAQDVMAWETQGPILDRSQEILGSTDAGVARYRRLLLEQIRLVQAGGTPIGVIPAEEEQDVIELDVTRDRHGLAAPERRKAN